jgi:phosphoserine phosphatase RsbU/P
MSRSNPPAGARPRIALLVDSFDAAYQAALVSFARQACERRGLRLVVFPGGVTGGRALAAEQRNSVYDLISAQRFAGLIVLAGTMTREVAADVVGAFVARFRPLPMCSIGARLDGIPSYLVDNAGGTRALVQHLVRDHGYRRLAYIGGPATHEEARERLTAFRDEVRRLGVELSPADIVHGDFMPNSGQTALDVLLARREQPPEVIVAANDAMAMGVLEALTRHPPELAGAIAVCGFDNVVETDFCSPPLTTVEQPLRRIAEAAVEGLVAQLAGKPCPELTRFDALPVLRRSCGCGATLATAPEMQRRMASRRGSGLVELTRHRDEILAQLSLAAGDVYDSVPRWRERLLDTFVEQVRGVPAADFFACARELLQHTMLERHGETWRFHNVLSALRLHCLPCLAGDLAQCARAEDLLQTARTLTGEAVLRGQAQRLLSADQQYLSTNGLGTQLSDARDESDVRDALNGVLRDLGIQRVIAVEYLDSKAPPVARARVLAFAESPERLRPPTEPFACTWLLPVDEWLDGEVHAWVALPLFYRGETLGFLLAVLCPFDGKAYEALRLHVSAAVWTLRQAGAAQQ